MDPSRYLFVEYRHGLIPAAEGDRILFKVRNMPNGISQAQLMHEQFCITEIVEGLRISATIIAVWCVGSPNTENESGKHAMEVSPSCFQPIIIGMAKGSPQNDSTSAEVHRHQHRSGRRFFTNRQEQNSFVLPSDICTLLSPLEHSTQSYNRTNICCVIVSRCLKKYDGMASQFLMWIRINEEVSDGMRYSVIHVQDIIAVPKLLRRGQTPTTRDPGHIGKLLDGRPYVTYRILLYCNDFMSSGSPYSKSSCGGVYIMPIGMTQQARRSRTAVHVISLTPPGVSTNEIVLRIIPDIVRGSKGIAGVLPSGEPVVIFLDIGFIADYPAATEPLDVLGHTADTPCTHCTIRKSKNNGSSSMGFTTTVHSSFSPSLRCAERHNALRESKLSNRETNILGMKQNEESATQKYPLSELREKLLAARPSIPLTCERKPFITGFFDPFRSSVIAPDPLLSGVARNVIDLFFRVLRPEQRRDLDIAVCSVLLDNPLMRQRTVYNDKKIQLHTMSLSSVFCVLLVFHPVCIGFPLQQHRLLSETLHLLKQLKDLIAMTYWSPSVDTDGKDAHDLMRIDDGKPYHYFLQGLAENYVVDVDAFCKSHPELGTGLDRPNLHRLLELYHHSIPAFGHVYLFQELVFETAHQPLKRSVERGNHRNAEGTAVEHFIGNDWQSRLGMLYDRLNSDDMCSATGCTVLS